MGKNILSSLVESAEVELQKKVAHLERDLKKDQQHYHKHLVTQTQEMAELRSQLSTLKARCCTVEERLEEYIHEAQHDTGPLFHENRLTKAEERVQDVYVNLQKLVDRITGVEVEMEQSRKPKEAPQPKSHTENALIEEVREMRDEFYQLRELISDLADDLGSESYDKGETSQEAQPEPQEGKSGGHGSLHITSSTISAPISVGGTHKHIHHHHIHNYHSHHEEVPKATSKEEMLGKMVFKAGEKILDKCTSEEKPAAPFGASMTLGKFLSYFFYLSLLAGGVSYFIR